MRKKLTKLEEKILRAMRHTSRVAHGLPKIMLDAGDIAKELNMPIAKVKRGLSKLKNKKMVDSSFVEMIKRKIWKPTDGKD